MRQVVLDGVLEVARGVAEAATVPALMVGSARHRTILDIEIQMTKWALNLYKVIDITVHNYDTHRVRLISGKICEQSS